METTRITPISSQIGKIVVSRILPGSDLVSSIIEICKMANIQTGAISVCIGSLRRAQFHWTVPSIKTKRGSERTDPIVLEGPIELLSGQGLVAQKEDNGFAIHFHGTLCDNKGRVWGGHFFPGGNYVHSTIEVVIIETQDVDFTMQYDPEIDLNLPIPSSLPNR